MASNKIEGMDDLERMFRQLGKVPQTVATKAARAGATIAYKSSKLKAPEDIGNLKRGIIMKKERRTVPGKAVYDIMINPAMNDVFVKVSKDGKRAYYPASMEYGYMTVDGGFVPGYHYLRDGVVDNKAAIEDKTIEVASKAIDKVMGKGR